MALLVVWVQSKTGGTRNKESLEGNIINGLANKTNPE